MRFLFRKPGLLFRTFMHEVDDCLANKLHVGIDHQILVQSQSNFAGNVIIRNDEFVVYYLVGRHQHFDPADIKPSGKALGEAQTVMSIQRPKDVAVSRLQRKVLTRTQC